MSAKTFKTIERAWKLRFRQKNAEVEELLESLADSSLTIEHQWQVRLLHASLLRAKGQMDQSNRVLDDVRDQIFWKTSRAPFQYYFQKAINVFVTGDFSIALEFFLLADSVAANSFERLSALMNILTCLENLNLLWDETLAEIETLLAKSDDESTEPTARQLSAFRLRHSFRNGLIPDVFGLELSSSEMDQSRYYQLWISHLPYLARRFSPDPTSMQKLARTREFHAKAYRMKTLIADPRLNDGAEDGPVLTAQQVDRIYLWTWRWLADPSERNRELLKESLMAFDFKSALKKMTYEDFQQLRNALLWVAAFQKPLAISISRYLDAFSVKDCKPFPIFEYEELWAKYVVAKRQGRRVDDLLKRIESHPLHGNADLKIAEIALRCLSEESGSGNGGMTPSSSSVIIDEETFRVVTKKKTVISESLAKILLNLSELKMMPFADLLWIGFGISSYDSGIHQPKIQNALSRIKELVPATVKIKTKDERVYWEGPANAIRRIQVSPREKRIVESAAHLAIDFTVTKTKVFERPVHPRMLVERANGKKSLRREELQEMMKLSKASTVRWLEKWLEQGLIRREGAGPSMRYHFEI